MDIASVTPSDSNANLVSITTLPDGAIDTKLPAIILTNAGFLHKVGPNRMNTLLARKLAELGFVSTRFDLSGLGDSVATHFTGIYSEDEPVVSDFKAIMARMEREHGVSSFVLIGLCSGGLDALKVTIADERVIGAVCIDSIGFRTPKFYLFHVLFHIIPRLFKMEKWRNLWNRFLSVWKAPEQTKKKKPKAIIYLPKLSNISNKESAEVLEKLIARSVSLNFIYTGGVSGFYNYHTQFRDMFQNVDFKGKVASNYFPNSDHLTMLSKHREEIHGCICNWVEANFKSSDQSVY